MTIIANRSEEKQPSNEALAFRTKVNDNHLSEMNFVLLEYSILTVVPTCIVYRYIYIFIATKLSYVFTELPHSALATNMTAICTPKSFRK